MAGSHEHRYARTITIIVALAGLGLLALGPGAVVLSWRAYEELRAVTHTTDRVVHDGSVTFELHKVQCGADDGSVNGQVCEVTIAARNDGADEISVPGRAQMLAVAEGARHPPADPDSTPFGELAPREAATAVMRYDIPKGVTVTRIEVRSDMYSEGVPIPIVKPEALPD